MAIVLREQFTPAVDKLLLLYSSVDWKQYTKDPERLAHAYQKSLFVITAWDDDHLVGAVRLVGDGISIIYIQDLLVTPKYQRRGIGRRLAAAALAKFPGVYQTVLLTDDSPDSCKFYEAIGFFPASQRRCTAFVKFQSGL